MIQNVQEWMNKTMQICMISRMIKNTSYIFYKLNQGWESESNTVNPRSEEA